MDMEEMEQARLAEWMDSRSRANLPDWDSLPQLELYMDQVIILLTEYLSPLCRSGEEKAVTASIINNYVRMHVMPPPRKKKYGRIHLACLVIICVLKQSLSISCIQRMLPEDCSEETVRMLYEAFVRQYRSSIRFLCSLPVQGNRLTIATDGASLALEGEGSLVTTSTILSTLSKALTEYLLQEDACIEEENDMEDDG